MEDYAIERKWYALHVRSRFEKIVDRHLRGKGYEEYLPLNRRRRQWSDRIKEIEDPLFPGYVFCKFDFTNRPPILVIPGVVSVASVGSKPQAVPEEEIRALQDVVQSGCPYELWPFIKAGQRVRVDYGPLRGVEGLVVEVSGKYRLIVSVNLLRRSVAAEIDSACVRQIPVSHSPRLITEHGT